MLAFTTSKFAFNMTYLCGKTMSMTARLMRTRDDTQALTEASLSALSVELGGGAVDFISELKAKNPHAWAKAREDARQEARTNALKFWRSPEGLKARQAYKARGREQARVPDALQTSHSNATFDS